MQSTGNPQAFPQVTHRSCHEAVSCVGCGRPIFSGAAAILTGGVRRHFDIEARGSGNGAPGLRFRHEPEGLFVVDHDGPWAEHWCDPS